MIKTVNLQKIFKTEEVETWALNNVNLEIKAGEFVAIMGPIRLWKVHPAEYPRPFGQSYGRHLRTERNRRFQIYRSTTHQFT